MAVCVTTRETVKLWTRRLKDAGCTVVTNTSECLKITDGGKTVYQALRVPAGWLVRTADGPTVTWTVPEILNPAAPDA